MKKYYFMILSLMMTSPLCAQDYIITDHNVTGIFLAEGKARDEIFDLVSRWIFQNYGTEAEIVQVYDRKNGNIIIRGINKSPYRNPASAAYPNDILIRDHLSVLCLHTMEFKIEEGRYSIIYTLNEVNHSGFMQVANRRFVKVIRLDTIIPESIAAYNLAVNANLKAGMMGKAKRDVILANSSPMFEELRTSIVSDAKSLMESVSRSVNESAAGWGITVKED